MRYILSALLMLSFTAPAWAEQLPPYISGGVGKTEQQYLKDIRPHYTYKITMADSAGAFTSNVKVTITNAQGQELMQTKTKGPILLVKLNPGTYSMESYYRGTTKTNTLTVARADERKELTIRW